MFNCRNTSSVVHILHASKPLHNSACSLFIPRPSLILTEAKMAALRRAPLWLSPPLLCHYFQTVLFKRVRVCNWPILVLYVFSSCHHMTSEQTLFSVLLIYHRLLNKHTEWFSVYSAQWPFRVHKQICQSHSIPFGCWDIFRHNSQLFCGNRHSKSKVYPTVTLREGNISLQSLTYTDAFTPQCISRQRRITRYYCKIVCFHSLAADNSVFFGDW